MFDLKIVNGTVVDGSGGPAFTADVAVRDGVIVAVGQGLDGDATEVIDATGLLVTPGFVDIHTHYDGQATWDDTLEPSFSHGVTTVVAGNCGVGFAPVRPGEEAMLIEMMEGVEDIPGTALHEGIQWEWETFAEYLDALARRRYSMDIAAYVPHAALRMYVMGARGATAEPATTEEIDEMARNVRSAMAAGAVGVSTSRSLNHKTLDGELVAGTFAGYDELLGLARAVEAAGGGVFQVVPTGETGADEAQILGEVEMLCRLAQDVAVEVSFLLFQAPGAPRLYRRQLELVDEARAAGARIHAQVAGRPGGFLTGVRSYHAFMRRPTFVAVDEHCPDTESLLAELRRPEVRAAILAEDDLPADPHKQYEELAEAIPYMAERLYVLADDPDYEPTRDASVAGIAEATGRTVHEVLYDHLAAGDLLLAALLNYADGSQDALAELLAHPATVVGLSDGGAHVRMICDGSVPTSMLVHWARDRRRGPRLPVELVVRKQTADTARAVGLTDRGTIEPGMKADLNVIDYERLRLSAPRSVDDLPAGGWRVLQDAEGYVVTVVSGVVTRRDDRDTGARPGRLVRSSAAACA